MSKKTAIISLDILSRKAYEEFKKLSFLQRKSLDEIWQYYPMIGESFDSKTMTREIAAIEPYLLLHYLKNKGFKCKLWYRNSLFIYNDSLYKIANGKIEKIALEGLYYFSLRETFSHPFFTLLDILLQNNGGKIAKPNKTTMLNNGCINKMYGIKELYMYRKEYLQDIIIPYNIRSVDYEVFFDFIKKELGSKVVFKNDCIQEGRGIIFKDIATNIAKELYDALDMHMTKQKELIITPLHNIKAEYRCYFTKYDNIKIFSIKQRVNLTKEDELFEKENIQINVNLQAKWLLIEQDTQIFQKASKTATDMLNILSYDTGCLEFAVTDDDKIIFFEVNQMAGPLPFKGEDCKNINKYYLCIFNGIIKE